MTAFEAPEGFVAVDESLQLYKKITKESDAARIVMRTGSTVTVHYTGTLFSNGDQFDSSRDRGDKFEFKIGQGQVIKGWDVGVASMKIGERCDLLIHSDYAYGNQGSPPKIPSKATLVFDVELFSVDASTAEMDTLERIQSVLALKEDGNVAFKSGDNLGAIKSYTKASESLAKADNLSSEQQAELSQLKIVIHSNLSAVYLKDKQFQKAVESSKRVLESDPLHSKAIYRLSKAKTALGLYEEAKLILENGRIV